MYKSLNIKNYRGIEDLTITPLERINLIVGKNNVGKTALLEAMWLHHGYHNPALGLRVDSFRGLERFKRDEFLWDLFSEFDPEKTIELSSYNTDDQLHTLHIAIRERSTAHILLHNGTKKRDNGQEFSASEMIGQKTTEPIGSEVVFDYTGPSEKTVQARAIIEQESIGFERKRGIKEPNGIFLAARHRSNLEELAERFSNLAVTKRQDRIIYILQIIEHRLKSLTVQHRGGVPMIYGDIGLKRLMPIPLMGEGVGRLLGVALAMPEAQDGIVLIDEVENGLHYTVMPEVWKAIAELAQEYNVQVFATTHSEECVKAAHLAFESSDEYNFRLHRLELIKDTIQTVTYDQESLAAAFKLELETRG